MLVIPVINVKTREEAIRKINIASGFARWVHVDISDGKFADYVNWGTPMDMDVLTKKFPDLKFEVHLMVVNPDEVLEDWLKSGAKRVVLHEETIAGLPFVLNLCKKYGAEIILSVQLHAELSDKVGLFSSLQVLAVPPGLSGQKFDERALEKISVLRQSMPSAKIEVDGGINIVTARQVKTAGADSVVSDSYIFGSDDPREAYEKLEEI